MGRTDYAKNYEKLAKTTENRVGTPTPKQVLPSLPVSGAWHALLTAVYLPCYAPAIYLGCSAHGPVVSPLPPSSPPSHRPLQGQLLKVVDPAMAGKPGFNKQGQPSSTGALAPPSPLARARLVFEPIRSGGVGR